MNQSRKQARLDTAQPVGHNGNSLNGEACARTESKQEQKGEPESKIGKTGYLGKLVKWRRANWDEKQAGTERSTRKDNKQEWILGSVFRDSGDSINVKK